MKFGYIGVGALSTPMLNNMLEDGHEILLWNRTAARAKDIAGEGATVVAEAVETATGGGIVVSCLANDQALQDVFGDGRIFRELGQGGVHISMSTCSPQMSRQLGDAISDHGGHHVTCPVLGRPDFVARRGHRHCVSGDREAFEQFRPVLQSISENIFFLDDRFESASVAKLCTNYLIASAVATMGESLALAVANGGDPQAIRKMWNQTYFPGVIYDKYSDQIIHQDFDPLFALNLMLKDIGLFSDATAHAGIETPLADGLHQRLQTAADHGLGELDFIAVSKLAFDQIASKTDEPV